jgi:hypothetical protein
MLKNKIEGQVEEIFMKSLSEGLVRLGLQVNGSSYISCARYALSLISNVVY